MSASRRVCGGNVGQIFLPEGFIGENYQPWVDIMTVLAGLDSSLRRHRRDAAAGQGGAAWQAASLSLHFYRVTAVSKLSGYKVMVAETAFVFIDIERKLSVFRRGCVGLAPSP